MRCEASSLGRSSDLAELIMDELTKKQADDLRRAAEYLTLQMRLTPHPTERSRIRAMADTADFVAERIDAHLAASKAQNVPERTPIGELLRRLPLGHYK
jgi:phosphoenolpyruvate carboxylase